MLNRDLKGYGQYREERSSQKEHTCKSPQVEGSLTCYSRDSKEIPNRVSAGRGQETRKVMGESFKHAACDHHATMALNRTSLKHFKSLLSFPGIWLLESKYTQHSLRVLSCFILPWILIVCVCLFIYLLYCPSH